MESIKLVVVFVFCAFFYINSSAQDTIYWQGTYKLKWEDFQGNPDSSSQHKAITTSVIKYKLSYDEKNFSCKVFCFFKKKKSWVIGRDSTLLQHEQGHFDIAELFARKFRKKIKEYRFSYITIDQDIEKIFKEISTEREKTASLYDKETNHSRNKSMQLYWSKKIKAELNNLEVYKE